MTTYELAKTLSAEQRKKMSEAGILSASVERYMYIYEMFVQLTADRVSVMDAYAEISRKCYTCEENVRKIIRRMQREI